MANLKVKLKSFVDHSYRITIRENFTNQIPKELKKHPFGHRYCIITDTLTKKIHGHELQKLLKSHGIECEMITMAGGEKSKSFESVIKLGEEMNDLGFNRKDCIIALGGGVVGDVAGFLAAIYMRGIPYIQIPTTLMAMVDSAIGGKNAVNSKKGKNMFGSIHQPQAVYIDSLFLETLPETEIQNGLAEVIKYGATLDRPLFYYLERKIDKIFIPPKKTSFNYNHKILNKIILMSCRDKAAIVERDEKEGNLRMVLNYGHTYGHAIEKKSNFAIPHGNAISIGMCLANEKAVREGLLKEKTANRIKAVFEKVGLPVSLPKSIKRADLTSIMRSDKKNPDKKHIRHILLKKIGRAVIA